MVGRPLRWPPCRVGPRPLVRPNYVMILAATKVGPYRRQKAIHLQCSCERERLCKDPDRIDG